MGYEVEYDMQSLEGRNRAVTDFESWAGAERVELLRIAIWSGEIETMQQLRNLCGLFIGISGAPVTAFAERHGLYE